MNSNLIQHLQRQQEALLDAVYVAMGESGSDPADSFKKHSLSAAQAAYDKSVSDLQRVHPMSADCPACICDANLYQFFSDFHKDAYGFRYRGDMSIAEMNARMPQMQIDLTANEEWERVRGAELDAEFDEQQREYYAAHAEQEQLVLAYCTDFDHHDTRLCA